VAAFCLRGKDRQKHALFDAIVVTCAPDKVPQPLVDQLKEGGRMIIPAKASGLPWQEHVTRSAAAAPDQSS
jgi:protein-L-isoaspartate O-methyltransferase